MPSKSQIKNFNNAILDCLKDWQPTFLKRVDFIDYYYVSPKLTIGLVTPKPRELFGIYMTITQKGKREISSFIDQDGFLIFNAFKAQILLLLQK